MENINKETSASVSNNATAQAGVKNEPKKNGYTKNYNRKNNNLQNKTNVVEATENKLEKTTETVGSENKFRRNANRNVNHIRRDDNKNQTVRNDSRPRNIRNNEGNKIITSDTKVQNVNNANTKLDNAINNAINFGFKKSNLKIIALGGLEKKKKNITVFEYENEIILVDCGLEFPDEDMLGVDLVIPDVTY